jgi:hypothetical protein
MELLRAIKNKSPGSSLKFPEFGFFNIILDIRAKKDSDSEYIILIKPICYIGTRFAKISSGSTA